MDPQGWAHWGTQTLHAMHNETDTERQQDRMRLKERRPPCIHTETPQGAPNTNGTSIPHYEYALFMIHWPVHGHIDTGRKVGKEIPGRVQGQIRIGHDKDLNMSPQICSQRVAEYHGLRSDQPERYRCGRSKPLMRACPQPRLVQPPRALGTLGRRREGGHRPLPAHTAKGCLSQVQYLITQIWTLLRVAKGCQTPGKTLVMW
jgi:hypothetical protein